jgi:hypothetical protein
MHRTPGAGALPQDEAGIIDAPETIDAASRAQRPQHDEPRLAPGFVFSSVRCRTGDQ